MVTSVEGKMVGIHLGQQLSDFVKQLQDQRILNEHFDNFLVLGEGNPGLVQEVIIGFCDNTENTLSELTVQLNEDAVDFGKVDHHVHQLRGASSSMGGRRLTIEVLVLRKAFNERDREMCLDALEKVKEEYEILKNNLAIISEMESNLRANDVARRCGA